jgi:hypothetical protein
MLHAREDYNERVQDNLPEDQGGIGKDEPVFLLRAKDICAPNVIRAWAGFLLGVGGDYNVIRNALDHADKMEIWQAKNGYKIPDAPCGSLA